MCSFKREFVQTGVRTNRVVYYKFSSQNSRDSKFIRTNGEFVQTGVRISGVLLYIIQAVFIYPSG